MPSEPDDTLQPTPLPTPLVAESKRPFDKTEYRRNLPHIDPAGRTVFVTFNTHRRWILPESVRSRVLQHCLHDNGTRIEVHGVVVMPDHVHMVFAPLQDVTGQPYALKSITQGIKGTSAHSINRMLERKGTVWQDESFDHILRCDESALQKVLYICENPVRRGLVDTEDDYPWLWRQWIEGEEELR